jgi:N-methylhydantoinase A
VSYFVGADIGGTFTDCVVIDDAGAARLYKAPTTLDDAARGVMHALELAETDLGLAPGALLRDVRYFGLGTTVATNALIERKGVKTGLITTRGFRDAILMQRGMGAWAGLEPEEMAHYSRRHNPEPLIPRSLIEEVTERVDAHGEILTPLQEADARRAIQHLIDEGVQAIAVCLLWSFQEPRHELRIAELVREMAPDVYLTISSRLAPVLGEYERGATVAMNAYLGPKVRDYMSSLAESWGRQGFTGRFRILDSGGGVITPETCGETPVAVLTSGPAGGVLASAQLAKRLGMPHVITGDMGGTSFDVGLIVDGEPVVTPLQQVNGYHIRKTAVKVSAIGAGGGSIARVVQGQLLVGPESAGSVPGPVCFGRGGTEPTVTDADVVLGILDPDYFVGGTMRLDKAAAEEAIRTRIAEPLGVSVLEAAAGIKSITDHRMADLLETLTVGQGHDPRDFAVFAYGGNGGTHCHAFGAELGVRAIVVPSTAPVHSAFGAVMSDLHVTTELSDPMHAASWDAAPELLDSVRISANFAKLEEHATAELIAAGALPDRITLQRVVDVRFRSQVNVLPVHVPAGRIDRDDLARMLSVYRAQYADTYGSEAVFTGAGVELVAFRVQGRGEVEKPRLAHVAPTGFAKARVPVPREITLPEYGTVLAEVLNGDTLPPGTVVPGPAIIEHPSTTIVIGPDQQGTIDDLDNTFITAKECA